MMDKFLEYVNSRSYDEIVEENELEEGEILLPEVESILEFVMIPVGKYEMLIRESEKLASITRYLDTEKPTLKCVRAMLEV